MRINVTAAIKNYEGEIIKKDDKPFTVRDALIIALNSQMEKDIITAEDKAKIYQLSIRIYAGKEVDLTLDDRSFIKKRADKFLSPLVYGRICDILEDKPLEAQKVEKAPEVKSKKRQSKS